ncbi:thiol-disulfide oxidoreductase DCC family protein [Halalkalibacter krulwichiae]|uniref:Thiol-disulfide oxidoreductase n=1 Tax=Halalkalibacter krulwichiae TaxID=199441 RepID=A0A1X9MB29_9BACI|nr:DCC1-like thiol-disulfide oxidoreductase family protein [Halalkalibacter krulwichiae]ARK30627.1 hypothetical protein BkAM31D_12750 [Halalkalibacter krulwichiae]
MKIILFDGVCNICHESVNFVIRRDHKAVFSFASLQGAKGKELIEARNVCKEINSLVLIEDSEIYYKSTAALRICKQLNGWWKVLYVFIIIPKSIRDFVYDCIAKNRYKWFGKKESCDLTLLKEQKRFLD